MSSSQAANDGYNPKSCNSLQKVYYRPIEAALRWCGLIGVESHILETVGEDLMPGVSMFPRWPCLRSNCEKIVDAMNNGNLSYGRDGITVPMGEQVAKHRRTIRHTDLKKWMEDAYPDQKPAFLFDEIERATHSKINADSFRALQADNQAQAARLKDAEREWLKQNQELKNAKAELARLTLANTNEPDNPSALLAVAALMEKLITERRQSNRNATQSSILQELEDTGIRGLSKSTMDKVLPDANRLLKDAKANIHK